MDLLKFTNGFANIIKWAYLKREYPSTAFLYFYGKFAMERIERLLKGILEPSVGICDLHLVVIDLLLGFLIFWAMIFCQYT